MVASRQHTGHLEQAQAQADVCDPQANDAQLCENPRTAASACKIDALSAMRQTREAFAFFRS